MMLPVDKSFLGARASNAGDAFHEIWALRKALELLDPKSGLILLTVEGVGNLSRTIDNRQWDGVDCALYYGETEDGPFDHVNLVQLRYSVAAPNNRWTLGRFTKTSSRNNNSLARRLATAFNEATKGMSFDEIRRKINVSLVTNQPVSPSLEKLVKQISDGKTNSKDAKKLSEATALSGRKLKLFCERLTLRGGEKSRADLNADVIHKIYKMIDTDVGPTLAGLKTKIGEQMLPEGRGSHGIIRATVESWFNVGQATALFPCEARFEKTENPINRDVSVELADAVKNHGLVCFHGGGGHGKSTVAQELESLLPSGSKVILYDCYGAGAYRDPSRYRHRPLEAFTQLSNELALTVRAPCLFPHRDNPDIIRSFRRRLELASELIETETPGAFLVVLIDAADNAVSASRQSEPADNCFVHDLVRMSELPDNARILISARTSRRDSLKLPLRCKTMLCPPFSEEETRQMVARQFPDSPDQSVEEFHYLSGGNPRVQSSALVGCKCFEDAVESLRPTGKSDSDIYKETVDKVVLRAGVHVDTDLFCSALSVLPSPAPIEFIASVCEISEPVAAELCEELTPHLRVTLQGVEFANEDFENFCEKFGLPHVDNVRQLCAEKFLERRFDSEYATIHLFNLLSKTGRGNELFDLVREKDSTRAIADPFVRRLTDLARLRAAVSVASRHDDVVEAAKTILVGSDALSTNSKITEIMVGNLDLSACFFEDTIRQLVLNNPDQWMRQGSLLTHLAKEYAIAGHTLKSRGAMRNVREWYHARTIQEKRREILEKDNFIAKVIGIYKNEGWKGTERYCEGFKSKLWSISIKHGLLKYIALSEGGEVVRNIRPKMNPQQRWIACVFAKRCGSEISTKELANDCKALVRFDLSCLKPDNSQSFLLIDDLLFFAELCKRNGVTKELVAELAGNIWPQENRKIERMISTEYSHIDFSYRAAFLETFDMDFTFDTEKIFQVPARTDNRSRDPDAKRNWSIIENRLKEVKQILPFYKALVNASMARTENDLDASLNSLLSLRKKNFSLSLHTWKFFPIAQTMARRIVDFSAMNEMMTIDRTLDTIDRLIPEGNPFFAVRLSGSLQLLMCNRMFFDRVIAVFQKYADASEDYTLPANEKAELMVEISRILLPVNRDEAKVYFKRALGIVEEIDFELIEKLYCITKMANRFSGDNPENRKRCENLAKLVRRAGIILGNEEYFPYNESVEAMIFLSEPVAACVFSRWTDEGFLSSNGYFLQEALKRKVLPETHLTALSLITEESSILMKQVCGNTINLPDDIRHAILAEFAKLELMELAPGSTGPMNESLKHLADNCDKTPEAFRCLSNTHEFLKDKGIETPRDDTTGTEKEARKVTMPDCTGVDVCDHESILAIMRANRNAGCSDPEVFYSELRTRVKLADRIRHLDAVASIAKSKRYPENEISHIISCLDTWPGNAIKEWAETTVPLLIIELGPKIMGYSLLGEGSFPSLVRASNTSDEKLKRILVTAVERNAQETGLWGLLKYAAALVNVLPEEQAGEVFDWYVSELNSQINVQEKSGARHDIPLSDLPETPDEIAASLLYRFLGDVDVRIRWRAAHSVRAFVRLGRNEVVRDLLKRALSPKPFAYVFGDIPFHELTAKLFLAITLARVAFEAPQSIAPLGKDILQLAADGPPHVLIAHHVKRALNRLLETGKMDGVYADEVKALASPAKGHVQLTERRKIRSFDHGTDQQDHVQFHFDPVDTLPYWYSRALENFTDISLEDFLTRADYWIVDKWGAKEGSWRWDREPRRNRFENERSSPRRHGSSYPHMESYPRYLEWHAMFVVVGELIKTHPVVVDEEERNCLELWIESWDTTYQGTWLSDLREPVPLELKYWIRPPKDDPSWLETMDEEKLHAELFTEKPGELVLLSYRETIQYYIGDRVAEQKVKVKSALVPPKTAPSLVRMFQAMEDPMYISLPDDKNSINNEKKIEGFVIRPTAVVHRMYRDSGFDSSDPTRYSIIGVNWVPADDLVRLLELARSSPWSRTWHSKQSGADICRYESWSTQRNDDHHLWARNRSDTATDGIRLTIHAESLLQVLKDLSHDLLVKVEITNSTGDDYGRRREEGKKEVSSFHFYLLRQDGTIEHADENVGAWFPDC